MKILGFILFSFITTSSFAQNAGDSNLVLWSSTRKLTLDDFGIKTKGMETNPSIAQFSVVYKVEGFDFMTKNFNKRVRNYFIKSASSIDTTINFAISLHYQQTLFDICEIYTRQFRKYLKENKKKIAFGAGFIDDLNQKAMTDFANRRILYDKETNFGTIAEKQTEWENIINKELGELSKFAYE